MWIDDIRNIGRQQQYVTKYISKGFDHAVTLLPDSLQECLTALRGRRMCDTFGEWRGMPEKEAEDEKTVWITVGKVESLWVAASHGGTAAIDRLRSLKVKIPVVPEFVGQIVYYSG